MNILQVPVTVNFNSSVTCRWFLHSTVVWFLAKVLDAFTCKVDVKFVLRPIPAMLVRVAMKGGLEVDTGTVKPDTNTIGVWRMSGLFHLRNIDLNTWQVKVTISPSQANCLPLSSIVEVSTTSPVTKRKYISVWLLTYTWWITKSIQLWVQIIQASTKQKQ